MSCNVVHEYLCMIGSNSGKNCLEKLVTKCVGDNFKMLVTVLAILVTNIHYLFT